MNALTAWAIVWVAVSVAVITGLYLTRDSNCLWAFVLPALISVKTRGDK